MGGDVVELDTDLGDILLLEESGGGGERSHGGLAQLTEASRQHCVVLCDIWCLVVTDLDLDIAVGYKQAT